MKSTEKKDVAVSRRINAEEKKKTDLNKLLIEYFDKIDRSRSNSIVSRTHM